MALKTFMVVLHDFPNMAWKEILAKFVIVGGSPPLRLSWPAYIDARAKFLVTSETRPFDNLSWHLVFVLACRGWFAC